MKNILIIVGLLCLSVTGLQGQHGLPADQYLHVIEVSTNARFSDTLDYVHGIVDHQSDIVIKLNRSEIVNKMLTMQGVARDDSRLESLYRIQKILDLEVDAIQQMNELVALDQAGQQKPYELVRQMAQTENKIIAELEKDTLLLQQVNSIEATDEFLMLTDHDPSYTFLQFMFKVLNEEAAELRQQFITEIEHETQGDSGLSVFFRLGAFVQNKQGGYPIHVENFDSYSPQEYAQSLSTSQGILPEEKTALAQIAATGELLKQELAMSQTGISSLFSSGEELFASRGEYDSLKQALGTTQQQLAALAEQDSTTDGLIEQVSLDLEQVDILYSTLTQTLSSLSTDVLSGSTVINRIQAGLTHFDTKVNEAAQAYQLRFEAYEQQQNATVGNARLDMFRTLNQQFIAFRNAVNQDVSSLSSFLKKSADLLNPLKKNSLENDQFTNKVRRFGVDNLPDQGLITLTTTGARPGEDIVIKAVIQRGLGPEDRFYEEVVLSRRVLRLERVSPHLKMGGSLILATPYNPSMTSDTVALGGSFQFAPSYTVFMSWGSRRSRFYNNYLGFGVGLGFSSPDFNLDGTPEFGVSGMVTALQDIVSAGWGWNFGVDTPFWYVGFNIPFTVGGIPNLGTTQSFSP